MQVDLKKYGIARIEVAIEAAIQRASAGDSLPPMERLEHGAKTTLTTPREPSSTYFQSIIEIAYLVASADGFAEEERRALSKVLERVVGHAIDTETLEEHFRALDAACEALGRRERMRRAAEDFVDGEYRREVLGFAAIVAIADGTLAEAELEALIRVGAYFGWTEAEVQVIVEEVLGVLVAALEGSS